MLLKAFFLAAAGRSAAQRRIKNKRAASAAKADEEAKAIGTAEAVPCQSKESRAKAPIRWEAQRGAEAPLFYPRRS